MLDDCQQTMLLLLTLNFPVAFRIQKYKVSAPKSLYRGSTREVLGKKVKDIKPVCSRNCAKLALIDETFVLIHLPKKPPHNFFFSDLNSIWCNVIYCMLYLIMVITVGFLFYPDVTML